MTNIANGTYYTDPNAIKDKFIKLFNDWKGSYQRQFARDVEMQNEESRGANVRLKSSRRSFADQSMSPREDESTGSVDSAPGATSTAAKPYWVYDVVEMNAFFHKGVPVYKN